jgi:hypothetical protein
MADQKRILMLALEKKVEALRMAGGLTLLDDRIGIATWGKLPAGADTAEQLEALEFAEVPMTELDPVRAREACAALAAQIIDSDVVYCV